MRSQRRARVNSLPHDSSPCVLRAESCLPQKGCCRASHARLNLVRVRGRTDAYHEQVNRHQVGCGPELGDPSGHATRAMLESREPRWRPGDGTAALRSHGGKRTVRRRFVMKSKTSTMRSRLWRGRGRAALGGCLGKTAAYGTASDIPASDIVS